MSTGRNAFMPNSHEGYVLNSIRENLYDITFPTCMESYQLSTAINVWPIYQEGYSLNFIRENLYDLTFQTCLCKLHLYHLNDCRIGEFICLLTMMKRSRKWLLYWCQPSCSNIATLGQVRAREIRTKHSATTL